MRSRNHGLICIILAIMVSLAGMCFEDVKTHSSFAYEQIQEENAHIRAWDLKVWDNQLCTTRMLRAQRDTGVQHLTSRFVGSRREIRFSLDCLCSNIFTLEQGKFFSSSAEVSFNNLYTDELVASFVHKADGKK